MNINPWRSTSVRTALKGLSFIDVKRIHIHSLQEAHDFLACYGFDLNDPADVAELEGLRLESIEFIQEELLINGELIPLALQEEKSISQYLLYASGHGPRALAAWSGSILRVIHTFTHSHSYFNDLYHDTIREQIFDRFNAHIHRNGDLCALGELKLEKFEFRAAKSRRSVAMKMMHKTENVSADIFDWIGIRFVTKYRSDVLDVLAFLRENHIVTYANIKPSKSRNTLFDLDWIIKSMNKGIPIKEIRAQMQIMDYPSVEKRIANNPFSELSYHSVQITCRQRIKIKQPDGTMLRFFFPFELQLMDLDSYIKSREGMASHDEYKKRQKKAVRQRVLPFLSSS